MTPVAIPVVEETTRTPLPELVGALRKVAQLNGLSDKEYEWLATHGSERRAEAGMTIFHEGDPAENMTILLKGEIHVRRERGPVDALFIGRSGQITGLLPFSRMKSYGGLGYTTSTTWGLEYHKSIFPEMLAAIPSMAQRCVGVLLDRVREVTRIEQQSEKLAALGKLAANLAHELNNPASAAQRAAAGLLQELKIYGRQKYNLGALCLEEENIAKIRQWQDSLSESKRPLEGDPAGASLREDGINQWLSAHGVENPWQISPELAESGITADQLDPLIGLVEPSAVGVVLSQFASSLRAQRMTEAMVDSTARIFDLIRAIKDYSYMDQAPIQEVDIPQSLENTLAMLQSRLQHVEVVRDYGANLPCISAYGSELNQVWMALIENALDAVNNHGKLRLSAHLAGDLILVEVQDDGIGIPPELKDRIFEPFFTTKAPGSGLGLGLDTVSRIIRKHRGFVTVQSVPGNTCFQVRLPLQQLQAY